MEIINLGNRVVNTYIMKACDKYLLVDTGYENSFAHFCRHLYDNNIELNRISYIFLTHAHDDHAGFLNELLYHTSAKIILHPCAVERLRYGQNSFEGGCSTKMAWLFCKAMAFVGKEEHKFPPIEKNFEGRYIFYGSEAAKNVMNELLVDIIETPGHTACSISLLLDNGMLFCGDAAMNGFPNSKRTTIWIENLSHYYKSWEVMLSFTPKIIYPGHGKPFSPNDLKKYLESGQKQKIYPL